MEKMEPWLKIPVVHTYEKVGFNCNPKKKIYGRGINYKIGNDIRQKINPTNF